MRSLADFFPNKRRKVFLKPPLFGFFACGDVPFIDALVGPLRNEEGVPSALRILDQAGRSCTRVAGPLRETGREEDLYGDGKLDLCFTTVGSRAGSTELSWLLDPAPCEVVVVEVELIEYIRWSAAGCQLRGA